MSTSPWSEAPAARDARKEAGEQTRRRLVEAAQDLIAQRGESAIRLRDLTALAQANVAAVHYHFGSLSTLLATAATEAVEQIIHAQVREVESLAPDATLHEIAAAYFRPMIKEVSGPSSRGRPYVGVLARIAADPPDELRSWALAATAQAHGALIRRLRIVLPDLSDNDLLLRVKCVGGILVLLSNVALEPELLGKSPAQIESMIVPVIAGALAAECLAVLRESKDARRHPPPRRTNHQMTQDRSSSWPPRRRPPTEPRTTCSMRSSSCGTPPCRPSTSA